MKPGLIAGLSLERTLVVTRAMCPHFDGVLAHPVIATWTLVHEFEITGRKLLVPFLEANDEALGTHVSIDHLAPAGIGATVRITATVESCTARKLRCDMAAHCGARLLARGKFDQAFVHKDRLHRTLERIATE